MNGTATRRQMRRRLEEAAGAGAGGLAVAFLAIAVNAWVMDMLAGVGPRALVGGMLATTVVTGVVAIARARQRIPYATVGLSISTFVCPLGLYTMVSSAVGRDTGYGWIAEAWMPRQLLLTMIPATLLAGWAGWEMLITDPAKE